LQLVPITRSHLLALLASEIPPRAGALQTFEGVSAIMNQTVSPALADYTRAGFVLVPIPPGSKGPNSPGWNRRQNCITTPERAEHYAGNIGIAHAYSGTCAIDFDDLERSRAYLAARGVDVDKLLAAPDAVRIDSGRPNRAKLLYRVPAALSTKQVHVDGRVVLEFRCATNARHTVTVQDVLPPSVHPDTGLPYAWKLGPSADFRRPPPLPRALLAHWLSLLDAEKPSSLLAELAKPTAPRAELPLERVETLLGHVGADQRDVWIGVGMALHYSYGGADDALGVWDRWSSKSTKYRGGECPEKWAGFGRNAGKPLTLGYVNKLAEKAGAPPSLWRSGPDPAAVFGVVEQPSAPGRFTFAQAGEFARNARIAWHVKGVIPKAELGMVYGASGDGKSFWAADVFLHAAAGKHWRGHRVRRPVRTGVVCAEGAGGYKLRLRAAAQHIGVDLEAVPFYVLAATPQLAEADVVAALIEAVRAQKLEALIVDTLAQVSAGLDENSSDMQTILTACKRIHEATGATVILIHHSGKDASKGARGWSGVKGALDFEVEVTRNADDTREARISKQKDGEDGTRFGFRLVSTRIDGLADEDGEPVSSCYVEPIELEALPTKAAAKLKLGPNELIVEKAVAAACGLAGQATVDAVVTEAVRLMAAPEAGERDQRRATARRALTTYAAKAGLDLKDGMLRMLRGAT
jgi:hypothetical protein